MASPSTTSTRREASDRRTSSTTVTSTTVRRRTGPRPPPGLRRSATGSSRGRSKQPGSWSALSAGSAPPLEAGGRHRRRLLRSGLRAREPDEARVREGVLAGTAGRRRLVTSSPTSGTATVSPWSDDRTSLNEGFATYAEWLWSDYDGGFTPQDAFDFYYDIVWPAGDPCSKLKIGDPGPDEPVRDAGVLPRCHDALPAPDDRRRCVLRAAPLGHAAHGNGNATTQDFIALAEEVSGQSLENSSTRGCTRPPGPWCLIGRADVHRRARAEAPVEAPQY